MIEKCAMCGEPLTEGFYITFCSTGNKVCEQCIHAKMTEWRAKHGDADATPE